MHQEISVLLAFAAGLLSFLYPSIHPRIPSDLFFLGGIGLRDGTRNSGESSSYTPHLAAAALSFILGFSTVFVVMSLLLSATFLLMGGVTRYINIAAGIIVIILGLNTLFNFLGALNYEKRLHPAKRPRGLVGAFLAGLAFGAGWTPCVGPILSGILLMAGQDGRMGQAALYLGFYSAGLALPFLGAALFFNRFLKHMEKLRSRLPLIQRISGVFLIGVGLFILLGRYQALNIVLMKSQWAFIEWAQSGAPLIRLLPALIFFTIALLPIAIQALRKKPLRSAGLCIFTGIFIILGIVQAAGLLDSAGLLARALIYQQQNL
jgi:cytochrome c-type biogenesis protein